MKHFYTFILSGIFLFKGFLALGQCPPDASIGVIPGSGLLEGYDIKACTSVPNHVLKIYNNSSTFATNEGYIIDWGTGIVEVFNNTTFPTSDFISHTYTQFGYYDINVVVVGPGGCTTSQTYTFYNGGNPSVGLAVPGNTTGLCAPATITFPITNTANNPSGTIYSVYVSGDLITTYTQENVPSAFTYTFDESSCGLTTTTGFYENAYDVQIIANNPCGSSQATIEPIEISEPPDPKFTINQSTVFCEGELVVIKNKTKKSEVISGNPSECSSLPPTWTITPGVPGVDYTIVSGNLFGSNTIQIIFHTPGNYTVTMGISSPSCGDAQTSQTFTVLQAVESSASVNVVSGSSPGEDGCVPSVAYFYGTSSGDDIISEWSISPSSGWDFLNGTSTTSEDIVLNFTEAGEYTIGLFSNNICSSDGWDTTLVIKDIPEVTIAPLGDFCEEATLNFDASTVFFDVNWGSFSSIEWNFPGGTPSSFSGQYPTGIYYGALGAYEVSLTATNECGSFTTTQTFNVVQSGAVAMPAAQDICQNAAAIQLTASPLGGTWSGNGIGPNGWFNPSSGNIGTNIISYEYQDGNCTLSGTTTITVTPIPSVDAGTDQEACVDANVFLIPTGTPSGGTWSVNNGGVLIGNDKFDPSASGAGVYTLTYAYTDQQGCNNEDTKTIIIHDLPDVHAGPDESICYNNNDITLTGFSPAGGTWSGTGVTANGIFNATNTPGLGSYILFYAYTDPITGCSRTDAKTITVTVNQAANAGPDEEICINGGLLNLNSGTPSGGVWIGTGVLNGTNIFDPTMAGVGTHIITYQNGSGICTTSDAKIITVHDLPELSLPNLDFICVNGSTLDLDNAAFPHGGVWSGNGILNNEFNPAQAGIGTHSLTYTFVDPNTNCNTSASVEIEVLEQPQLIASDTAYCFVEGWVELPTVNLTGGTWSGAGVSNNLFDPVLAGGLGTYDLVYQYADNQDCKSSVTVSVEVYTIDDPDFSMPESVCRNEMVTFENLSNPSYIFSWSFGDGNTSTDFSPNYAYDVAGTYPVTLTTSNVLGCTKTITDSIIINDTPVAYFEPDTNAACVGLEMNLTNLSVGVDLAYHWTLGENLTSNEENPGIVYLENGIGDTAYIITLQVSNICGASTYQDVITVHPQPVANIGLSELTDCSPLLVEFANISTGAATDFYWDFGNGNTSTQVVPPTQTYVAQNDEETSFTVTLVSSNLCGSDTVTTQVVVDPPEVVAVANAEELSGCHPFTVNFENNSTPGAVTEWDFGDGNKSSAASPSHTYETPGFYNVILYAYSDCGYDTSTLEVMVYPPPHVEFGHPLFVCQNQPISFENLSVNVGSTNWDFGDGNTSTLSSPEHIFTQPGEYTVTLTAISLFSQCPATFTSTVTVLDLPVAAFEPSSLYGCAPFEMQLTNTSQDALFFQWDFGDGNFSSEYSPSHWYETPGTYQIALIASDNNGCFHDTTIYNINIYPSPKSDFEYEKQSICDVPADVGFTNLSEGATQFLWDFGNGFQATNTNPSVTYTEATTYQVSLLVENEFGCQDSSAQNIRIYPQPVADFEVVGAEGCEPIEVIFNNTSAESNLFYWDFGNGKISNTANPTVAYEDDGVYDVQLKVSIDDVCFDSVTVTSAVNVYAVPQADFEVEEVNAGTSDGTIQITNLSVDGDHYYWEFSDGHTSNAIHPRHRFMNNGNQQIYLDVTTSYGCQDDTLINFVPKTIKGLFIPNAFSPEQGIGDVRIFQPAGIGLKEYHIQIFSPYGQLLWESREIEEGQPAESWDGTLNGKLMPQDVYVWKAFAIFEDGSIWQGVPKKNGGYKSMGSVTLLR
ncbi:MAG: PKD domain-containing protein [Bacteroidota bacterium]